MNDAVKAYVEMHGRQTERDLEATIESLRRYLEADPNFSQAIAAVVDAEAALGKDDPSEGNVVLGQLIGGRLIKDQATTRWAPPRQAVHRLLKES